MATAHDNFEKGIAAPEDSGSDKARVEEVDKAAGVLTTGRSRVFEAPEFIRNWTPEERHAAETKLKRKIDIRLMPMIVLMYIMNYLDRNNIAAAKLAGILTDLDLKGSEFNVSLLQCHFVPS